MPPPRGTRSDCEFTEGQKALIGKVAYEIGEVTSIRLRKEITEAIVLHQATCDAARETKKILEKLVTIEELHRAKSDAEHEIKQILVKLFTLEERVEVAVTAAKDIKGLTSKVAAIASVIGAMIGVAATTAWNWLTTTKV